MAGRAATAIAGAWPAIRAELRGALWVVMNARQVMASLQTMFEMQRNGGTVVRVPADNPMICTLIQLDGDIVTLVKPGVLEGHSRDELKLLIKQHRAALKARLPDTGPGFAESLAGFVQSLRYVSWVAPATTVATAGAGVATGAPLLDALESFAPFLVASCVPFAIRLAAPPVLRLVLSHGLLRLRL